MCKHLNLFGALLAIHKWEWGQKGEDGGVNNFGIRKEGSESTEKCKKWEVRQTMCKNQRRECQRHVISSKILPRVRPDVKKMEQK